MPMRIEARPESLRQDVRSLLMPHSADPLGLITALLERSTNCSSPLHGEEHWRAVALAGISIGVLTPGTDLRVVFLFALFHDAVRWDEGDDPDHGARGAALVRQLMNDGLLSLPDDVSRLLKSACRLHADGLVARDPTVGACWDADRLNLWRVGLAPDSGLMSTAEGGMPERIEWARVTLHDPPSWETLLDVSVD